MPRRLVPLLCSPLIPLLLACTPTAGPAEEPAVEQPVSVEQEPEGPAAGDPEAKARPGVSLGPVTAQFIPQYDAVYPTSAGGQAINVLIRLSAAEDEDADKARPPLDLAIVLDRSGSMSGDKIRYAKQAGLDLLARLGDQDQVTLITYDDTVYTQSQRLRASTEGIASLRSDLLALTPGDTTALGPALFRALDILGVQDQGQGASLSHVILLSDGLANVGEQRPQVIGEAAARGFGAGVSVSTLGMGLDYNEDLMTKVADEGGGRYHFIEDAEHIPAVLADEFAGLTSTVASEVGLDFDARNHASVARVYGYVSETQHDHTQIRVGYLSAGQDRDIIARVEVPPVALQQAKGSTLDLGEITVRFRLVEGQDLVAAADTPLLTLRLPAQVSIAGSEAEARASEHTEVTVRVAEVEAAAVMQAATSAVDRGDFSGAEQVLQQAEASYDTKLEAANSEAEREQLAAEKAEVERALDELDEAKHSAAKRKKYSKQYKASSYSKGKGSKKKKPMKKK